MNLLSLVSIAISAAISAQPIYTQSKISIAQNVVDSAKAQSDEMEDVATEKALSELANRIFMAEHTLSAFYLLAYQ